MKTQLITLFLLGILFYLIINNKNGFSIGSRWTEIELHNMTHPIHGKATFKGNMDDAAGLFNGLGTIIFEDNTTINGEFLNGQLPEGTVNTVGTGIAWIGTFPVIMNPTTGTADLANHIPSVTPWLTDNASGTLIDAAKNLIWEGTFINGLLHVGTFTNNNVVFEGTFDDKGALFNGTITYPGEGITHIYNGKNIALSCGIPTQQSWMSWHRDQRDDDKDGLPPFSGPALHSDLRRQ